MKENTYMNLRQAREKAGITREQAAVALGVGNKTLYNWEINNKVPSNVIEPIRKLYGIKSDSDVLAMFDQEAS